MNILNEISSLTNLLDATLSQEIQSTNSSIKPAEMLKEARTSVQSHSEEDSIELLMNNIGLQVQRRGGQ